MRNHYLFLLLPTLAHAFSPLPLVRAPEVVARDSHLFSSQVNERREPMVWLKDPQNNVQVGGVKSGSIVVRTFQFLLDAVVTVVAWPIATLLAKVINHPPVRKALGQCIVSGFKDICSDPKLDAYVDKAMATVNEDLGQDAREAGEAVPNLMREFFLGMLGIEYVKQVQEVAAEPLPSDAVNGN